MNNLVLIIIATFLVSLVSFIGILIMFIKTNIVDKILLALVALSAGALMGGAFLHLIPEAVKLNNNINIFIFILIGFSSFFLIEKVLHWQHCHEEHCEVHSFAYMNLVGDFFHNFIDGLIIAASFIANFSLGVTTSLAIALHEIPQEFGDFGVLIYGGFKKSKALLLNFAVALVAVIGGVAGFFLSTYIPDFMNFIIPIAAGGFIYIAASDLIPELRKDSTGKSLFYLVIFIVGIVLMYLLRFVGV